MTYGKMMDAQHLYCEIEHLDKFIKLLESKAKDIELKIVHEDNRDGTITVGVTSGISDQIVIWNEVFDALKAGSRKLHKAFDEM